MTIVSFSSVVLGLQEAAGGTHSWWSRPWNAQQQNPWHAHRWLDAIRTKHRSKFFAKLELLGIYILSSVELVLMDVCYPVRLGCGMADVVVYLSNSTPLIPSRIERTWHKSRGPASDERAAKQPSFAPPVLNKISVYSYTLSM